MVRHCFFTRTMSSIGQRLTLTATANSVGAMMASGYGMGWLATSFAVQLVTMASLKNGGLKDLMTQRPREVAKDVGISAAAILGTGLIALVLFHGQLELYSGADATMYGRAGAAALAWARSVPSVTMAPLMLPVAIVRLLEATAKGDTVMQGLSVGVPGIAISSVLLLGPSLVSYMTYRYLQGNVRMPSYSEAKSGLKREFKVWMKVYAASWAVMLAFGIGGRVMRMAS